MDSYNFLIADDSALQRKSLSLILNKCGFKVVGEAKNGFEAVEKYNSIKPDIMTMDITMPEMNGMEALEKIIETEPNAKIIMVSSEGDKVNIDRAYNMGALGFIIKPLTEEKIQNAISEIVF